MVRVINFCFDFIINTTMFWTNFQLLRQYHMKIFTSVPYVTHSNETSRKCWKIIFQICWCWKCWNSKLLNDISLVKWAQSFTNEIPLFSVDLWHVYWPVFQKVFWRLTAGFVGVGHIWKYLSWLWFSYSGGVWLQSIKSLQLYCVWYDWNCRIGHINSNWRFWDAKIKID